MPILYCRSSLKCELDHFYPPYSNDLTSVCHLVHPVRLLKFTFLRNRNKFQKSASSPVPNTWQIRSGKKHITSSLRIIFESPEYFWMVIFLMGMLNLTHDLRLRYCYIMKQRWVEYLELNALIKGRFLLSCNNGFKLEPYW